MASTVIGLFSARGETRSNPRPSSIELRPTHLGGQPDRHGFVEVPLEAGHGSRRQSKHEVLAQITPANRLARWFVRKVRVGNRVRVAHALLGGALQQAYDFGR